MSEPQSDKTKILIQLDPDPHPSSFDRVVAIDAGVDQLFSYGRVTLEDVEGLVHGAIFTRGPKDLHRTAIFIGGSDVSLGERLLDRVKAAFLGPLSVSVMLDANGANTTAAAAVLAARKHVDLAHATALVLAGTGPVGQRAARLLAGEGARVRLASRSDQRARTTAQAINQAMGKDAIAGCSTSTEDLLTRALDGVDVVIAAGAAGIELLPADARKAAASLKVAIDLNAVPPLGIEGVAVMDKAADRDGVIAYGAIGVGGTKMKIHKAAIAALFHANNTILDADQIYALAKSL